jgi:hypothetical protein
MTLNMAAMVLNYASEGLPIFPLHTVRDGRCTCGKPSCESPGKHPIASLVLNGHKNATKDSDTIRQWWTNNPDANIGIATGKNAGSVGILVVDVDGEKGEAALTQLVEQYGSLPKTKAAKTGKGRHLYFRYSRTVERVKCSTNDGLDIKADGGYVVGPPSMHASGRRYEWVDINVEYAEAPDWLIDYANGARRRQNNIVALNTNEKPRRTALKRILNANPLPDTEEERRRLASALSVIPSGDRSTWLTVGMALHSTGRSWAKKTWDVWSRSCPEKFSEQGQDDTWRSFDRPYDGPRVTVGTIFHLAEEHGWKVAESKTVAEGNSRTPHSDLNQHEPPSMAEEVEAVCRRLADLSRVEYDRVRGTEAEKLGIRVGTLDDEVNKYRAEDDAPRAGRPLALPLPDPWPDPVDGGALLDELVSVFTRYVMMPPASATAAALWCMHAHAFEASTTSPRLFITSPEKRCGKTTLLRVIQALVPKALQASNITAAALFRTVEAARPTLLIDEADTFLSENEELRGIINSGHARDGQVIRLVGDDHEPRAFSTWCPTAIAAIGNVQATIEDRSIVITMRRRRKDEKVERFRSDKILHLEDLQRKAARWVADNLSALRAYDPDVPASLNDRAADNWRPLLAIADLAGSRWEARVREAIAAFTDQAVVEDDSLPTKLLADIREAFAKHGDKIKSEVLVGHLKSLPDRPWADFYRGNGISTSWLAGKLKPFGIRPGTIRLSEKDWKDGKDTAKGYSVSWFGDAFSRYLPSENVTP